jgi:hypothetical protein
MAKNPMDFLYESKPGGFPELGDAYCPPSKFRPRLAYLVAELPAEDGGLPVRVYESRCPAACYAVEVDAGAENPDGFKLSTGSGSESRRLAAEIAKAITGGMLIVEVVPAKLEKLAPGEFDPRD